MRKICFVCTGNTCRSVMAEKLMKKHLDNLDVMGVEVLSRGLSVVRGDKINPKAVIALKNYGIRKCSRTAKQLTQKELLKPDIIFITMTQEQKEAINKNNNAFTIGELVGEKDVIDPYGYDQEIYNKTASILWQYTEVLAKNLNQ